MANLPWFFVPLLFSLALLIVWFLTLRLISSIGGWSRMGRRYAEERPFSGETRPFVSARIGVTRYRGVLIVGADASGLHLRTTKLFRPFHRPLFIPWLEIRADLGGGEDFDPVRLTFPAVPGFRITFVLSRLATWLRPFVTDAIGEQARPRCTR